MERRYKLMSALGVRNLAGFNQKITRRGEGRQAASPTRSRSTPDNPRAAEGAAAASWW